MYEYRFRPSYHRLWYTRVHSFVSPPIQRRTQSLDPSRGSNLGYDHSWFNKGSPADSNNAPRDYIDSCNNPPNSNYPSKLCSYHNENEDQKQGTKLSNNEIDQILTHIRRSRSVITDKGFNDDFRTFERRPDQPKMSPPPLPKTESHQFSNVPQNPSF